jgi:hypothetical protein
LFEVSGSNLSIDSETVRREDGEALATIVKSMLRLGARDYARALQDSAIVVEGEGRELAARRKTVWMTRDDVVHFNDVVEALLTPMSREPRRGRLYAVTVLLAPLDSRRRTGKAKPRKGP